MAVSCNINIIAGSMIEVGEDDRLYNVAYLCHRDGTLERQAKLHITPQERRDWVIEGGDDLQVFDTDAGRIGRSEEHTSELQSRPHLVCRLLLEKKKITSKRTLDHKFTE